MEKEKMRRIVILVSILVMDMSLCVQASSTRMGLLREQQSQALKYRQQFRLYPESQNTNTMECPVCLDTELDELEDAVTNCGHRFCVPCIKQVMKSSSGCPLCRTKIETINGQSLKNHEFVYRGMIYIIPVQYRQDVEDLIRSLTPEEYATVTRVLGLRIDLPYYVPGSLEWFIARNPQFGDSGLLPFEDRLAMFLDEFSLPMRPDYRRSWIPLWFKIGIMRRSELNAAQQERMQAIGE